MPINDNGYQIQTLGDIITDVRNRTDLNATQFVTDKEMTTYINYSTGELWGLIVNSFGGDYFANVTQSSVPAGDIFCAMPIDLYKVLGVDLFIGGAPPQGQPANNRITLQPFNFNERNRATSQNIMGYATQQWTNYRYKILSNAIMLQPPAVGNVDLAIWYVPQPPQFLLDSGVSGTLDLTQTFNLQEQNGMMVNPMFQQSGWLEYIITDVCIKCKEKEETDASIFMRQKQALIERIRNEAQFRDQGMPATVSDVYAQGTVTDPNSQYWWNWGNIY